MIAAQQAREQDILAGYQEAAAAAAARLSAQANPSREELLAQEQVRQESIARGRAAFGIRGY